MNQLISTIANRLLSTVESEPGVLSTTRVVTLVGALVVIFTSCAAYAVSTWTGRPMPEVPPTFSALVVTILGSLFTTKMVQSAQENKTPPTNEKSP